MTMDNLPGSERGINLSDEVYTEQCMGISTLPSSLTPLSKIATIILGTAIAVPFSVCAN